MQILHVNSLYVALQNKTLQKRLLANSQIASLNPIYGLKPAHDSASGIELTNFALHLAKAAGEAILPHFRKNAPIEVKAHETWDPVTEGDRAGERAMRQLIETHYPSHGIIGEEYGSKKAKSRPDLDSRSC